MSKFGIWHLSIAISSGKKDNSSAWSLNFSHLLYLLQLGPFDIFFNCNHRCYCILLCLYAVHHKIAHIQNPMQPLKLILLTCIEIALLKGGQSSSITFVLIFLFSLPLIPPFLAEIWLFLDFYSLWFRCCTAGGIFNNTLILGIYYDT